MLKANGKVGNMGLNSVAEYLKIPLELATDIRKRQDKVKQARQLLPQGSRILGPEKFRYYENDQTSTDMTSLSPTLSQYIERRFIPTLHWYQQKARSDSRRFSIWKTIVVSSALFLAIINAIDLGAITHSASNSLVPLASAIAAITILTSFAYLQVSRIHENRIQSTVIKQKLEKEYQLFMLRAKQYVRKEGIDDSYATQLFVENVESIIANEQ
jgi:uncharacterized membrane-anchored protein